MNMPPGAWNSNVDAVNSLACRSVIFVDGNNAMTAMAIMMLETSCTARVFFNVLHSLSFFFIAEAPVSDDSVKSDTVELANVTRGLSVNADGNIVCVFRVDTTAVTIAVVAGVVYPFRIRRINSTNTTATGITGYF